jgi:hypothetical protein
MRKLIASLFLLTLAKPWAVAQVSLELQGQYCTFNMKDLKTLQDQFFYDLPVSLKKVNTFPNYFGLRGSIAYALEYNDKEVEIGGVFMYTSTGGRIQYKDFSGNITGDQLTNALTIGILGRAELAGNEQWKFGASLVTGIDLTELTLSNSYAIGASVYESSFSFKAIGVSATPSLYLKYNPKQKFYYLVEIGYKITVYQEPYTWTEDERAEIYLEGSSEPMKPQWNGLRAGIGVGYFFIKH